MDWFKIARHRATLKQKLRQPKTVIVLFLILLGLVLVFRAVTQFWPDETTPDFEIVERAHYKINPLKGYQYQEIEEELPMENLVMIGNIGKYGVEGSTKGERLYGMIIRVLRFQNISRLVEKKYGLPENLILAMVMQETGGDPTLPNAQNDGGLGLCHMQPSTATEFGLKIYNDCNKLISTKHGKELRELIKEHNWQLSKLVAYDDRFNPVINLDAAARMLAYHRDGRQTKDTPLKTAIRGYCGERNFRHYYRNVMDYRNQLNNPTIIEAVEEEFNKRNPDLKIGDEEADYDDYIEFHYGQSRNYGLDKLREIYD